MTTITLDPYANVRSLDFRFRQKRYALVKTLIDSILAAQGRCRIIDLGGTETYWRIASDHIADKRISVDLVNLGPMEATGANFKCLNEDARDLVGFPDMSYDLVHSNSLLEHVGTWNEMLKLAANIRRLAPAYFVQTPYFWFPIEPHFRLPLFHWLPESWRYRLIMERDFGYVKRATSVADAVRAVQDATLLDKKQMSALFPDAA